MVTGCSSHFVFAAMLIVAEQKKEKNINIYTPHRFLNIFFKFFILVVTGAPKLMYQLFMAFWYIKKTIIIIIEKVPYIKWRNRCFDIYIIASSVIWSLGCVVVCHTCKA